MKILYLFSSAVSLFASVGLLLVSFASSTSSSSVSVAIFPGNFHLSIFGDLVEGVNLSGLGPVSLQEQVGYWNGEAGVDYLSFFDSTDADGFRIQFALASDFIYDGTDANQEDITPDNFLVYASWNEDAQSGVAPVKALDNDARTLSIDSEESCSLAVPSSYDFNAGFSVDDFAIPSSLNFTSYLESSVSCTNTGIINLGRFELDLGTPSVGFYRSSLIILMLDG